MCIRDRYHPGVYADNHPKVSLPDSFSLAVLFRDEYFVIGFIGCFITVSYTHLDVYKRQVRVETGISCFVVTFVEDYGVLSLGNFQISV